MSIILNELTWTKNAIEHYDLGPHPAVTLGCVAKYYRKLGFKRSDIRKKMEEFLLRCDPYASLVLWSGTLDGALKYGMKHDLVIIDRIVVTRPEMERIRAVKGIQAQRLAFTLLCIAKYRMAVNPSADGWVSTPESEISRMANIKSSYKQQNLLYGQLLDDGLLQASKKITNLNVKVLFLDDGEEALSVTDFRSLGNQYMMYIGKPYFVCKNCGLTVKVPDGAKPGKMKYCPDCAVKIHMQQQINSVMRSRGTVKAEGVVQSA